jgi:hypothetical protein
MELMLRYNIGTIEAELSHSLLKVIQKSACKQIGAIGLQSKLHSRNCKINIFRMHKDKPLSVQQACTAFGGTLCTSLCHRGRGGNKMFTLFSDLCCAV